MSLLAVNLTVASQFVSVQMATNGAIVADPLSNEPHTLWEQHWSKERKCHKVDPPLSLGAPIKDNAVRFVCISDTHEQLGRVIPRIPDGDVLVHCGDITNFGDEAELKRFNDELGLLPHKYKIVIAGNHDLGFEDEEDESKRLSKYKGRGTKQGYRLLTNCIYLHDSFTTVYGLKVYGSSWHPLEGFSFTRSRGEDILAQWRKIPSDVDVLLTHTPPLGHCDLYKGERWGDADLLNVVERQVRPKLHVFGHVHEQQGMTTNGVTTFINASICTHGLVPSNNPILFDIPLPPGHTKHA
ncbi:Protein C25E10.12 [Aphelenchoides avenae]|nr:Protein C25E10.12 [Aphelenchus avenae]